MQEPSRTVTKYNGKSAKRENCRRIKGEFYEMNIDCFLVDGKWNRITNGNILLDNETNRYVKKKNHTMVEGIINARLENGFFTPNPLRNINIILDNGNTVLALSEDVLPTGFSYDTKTGTFRKGGRISKKSIGVGYNEKLTYRAVSKLKNAQKVYERTTLRTNSKTRAFIRRISPYTIGLEFETLSGFIPQHNVHNAGLIAVRDGSLRHDNIEPYEYVTIPILSEVEVPIIKEACRLLNKYCVHDYRGSFHVHVGGMNTSPHTVVGIWRLLQMLQDEIYSYFPSYKRDGGGLSGKTNSSGTSYCAELPFKLPKYSKNYEGYVKASYKTITDYLSGGLREDRDAINHFSNVNKWNISARYHFVNLFNLLYTDAHTVEFRIHENTFNLEKVVKWIYVCVAIVRYAENNTRKCIEGSKITLKDVLLEGYHSTKANDIYKYMQHRKLLLADDNETHNKLTRNDAKFKFSVDEL